MTTITKDKAKNYLKGVEGATCFYCQDGSVFCNLRDLLRALKNMPEDIFYYHSNKDKSDFYQWIKNVFGDEKLAEHFWRYREKRAKLYQVLYDHLEDLERAARGKTF